MATLARAWVVMCERHEPSQMALIFQTERIGIVEHRDDTAHVRFIPLGMHRLLSVNLRLILYQIHRVLMEINSHELCRAWSA